VWNVVNPRHGSVTGLQERPWGGRPTVMGAEIPAGQGVQEAKAGSRKAAGNHAPQDRDLLPEGAWITGRIPGETGRAREGADVDR
jgi:hypothetical protein